MAQNDTNGFEEMVERAQSAPAQSQNQPSDLSSIDLSGLQQQANTDMLSALYGPSTPTDPAQIAAMQQQQPQLEKDQLEAARKKFHQQQHMETYYVPTFEQRKHEETLEERLAKEEQEKQEKKMAEWKEEEKKQPLPKPVKGPEKAPGAG